MNIKKLTLFVSLFSLLLLGQGSAAVVSNVSVDSFNDGTAYSLEAWWVGFSSADQDEIALSTDGTYDIVSTTGITTLNIKINLTGYAMWSDIYNYTGVPDALTATVGQLDIFVDGYSITVAAGFAGGAGATVTIVGVGDHTVSYLYSNMDEDGTYHYATDSITVRMRSTDSFATYKTTTFPINYAVTDSAAAGQNISRMHMLTVENYIYGVISYSKNVTVAVDNSAGVAIVANDDGTRSVDFTGTIDSTGSIDDSTIEWVDSTVGRVFVVDAAGLHLYTGGAMDVTLRAEDPLTSTYLGLYVQGDAGVFYEEEDLEEFFGTTNDTGAEEEFVFSFDFLGALVGGSFGNVPTGTTQVTVESTITSTETVESPGFSGFEALLGLLALGTIAFLIPRRFRK
ncbi:MAG: hypothetical protein GPJ54_20195 [Candidatus Heimdallarchaeota archaeon]|nr:hypothetical protein [Candidatus Heimdallarchaeota archaeon]